MNKIRIFISSVQKEFKEERKALCDYLCNDALLSRFFEPFLFEDFPAVNRKPFPANPLLAESLYLAKYIERMGTGTRDMIKDCRNAGLLEPEFNLTDGFVATVYRRPGRAFEAVGGKWKTEPPSRPSGQLGAQAGTKLALSLETKFLNHLLKQD